MEKPGDQSFSQANPWYINDYVNIPMLVGEVQIVN
jgi:hypothetical protein